MNEVKCMGCGKLGGTVDELAAGSFVWVCSQQCRPHIYEGAELNAELAKRWAESSDAKLAKETILMLELELERTRAALLAGGRSATQARRALGKMPPPAPATLDGIADVLEPGQSIIVSRVADAQRAELAKIELDGAWTVTVVEEAPPGGEEACTLFVEAERATATKRALFYLTGKNQNPAEAEST